MARRMKKKDAQPSAGEISADELKRVIKEHGRQSSSASEYAGLAGQAVKTAIDRYSLDRKAFRYILGMNKQEEQKRQATIRQTIELAHKAGFFDQTDAFDDVLDRMEEIIAEVRARRDGGGTKQDETLSALTH